MNPRVLLTVIVLLAGLSVRAQSSPILYIAFAAASEAGAPEDIYLVSSQGGDAFALTLDPARDWHPTWSPDGARIAFASTRAGSADLWIMDFDGQSQTAFTATPDQDETAPAWSPLGDRIAYILTTPDGTDVYTQETANEFAQPEAVTRDGLPKGAPAFSPDGRQIAFWRDVGGGVVQIVTVDRISGQERVVIAEGNNNWPAYAPSGDRLAFFRITDGLGQLFVYDLARDTFTALSDALPVGKSDLHPAWSPDGARITFASDRDGRYQIYTQLADGAGTGFGVFLERLTSIPGVAFSPEWQPRPPAPILTSAGRSLPQSARVVQDPEGLENQALDDDGAIAVYAPEQVAADQVFTVRVEMRSRALVEGAAPSSAPPPLDLAARLTQPTQLYRYMGARLDGFDIGNFQIRPDYNAYYIEVDPTAVNFWEWRLRVIDPTVSGPQDLVASVFLPIETRDGVTLQQTILDADVSVEVVPAAPALVIAPTVTPTVADRAVVPAAQSADDGASLRVVYTGRARLTLIVLRSIDVSGVRIAGRDGGDDLLADAFDVIGLAGGVLEPNVCLHYVLFEARSPLPRACDDRENYVREVGDGDAFWLDLASDESLDTVIRDTTTGTTLAICSASDQDGCAVPNMP